MSSFPFSRARLSLASASSLQGEPAYDQAAPPPQFRAALVGWADFRDRRLVSDDRPSRCRLSADRLRPHYQYGLHCRASALLAVWLRCRCLCGPLGPAARDASRQLLASRWAAAAAAGSFSPGHLDGLYGLGGG